MVIGSTVVRDVTKTDFGASVFQGSLKSSPCPGPTGNTETGVLLLIANSEMAADPSVSKKLESAFFLCRRKNQYIICRSVCEGRNSGIGGNYTFGWNLINVKYLSLLLSFVV